MVKSEGTEGYAIVGTTLKGAVWDLLCRTTPHVGLLEVVEEAYGRFSQIALLVNYSLAMPSEFPSTIGGTVRTRGGSEQWNDALDMARTATTPERLEEFDQAQHLVAALGAVAFGDKVWQRKEGGILPAPFSLQPQG